MKILTPFCFCLGLCFIFKSVEGQTKTPTNDEAVSACITLERLLDIARKDNRVEDARALNRSYSIARSYVTNAASVRDADTYVANARNSATAISGFLNTGTKGWGGFSQMINPNLKNSLDSDPKHKTGVVVYGKDGSVENLHLTLDKDSLSRMLKQNGAVHPEGTAP